MRHHLASMWLTSPCKSHLENHNEVSSHVPRPRLPPEHHAGSGPIRVGKQGPLLLLNRPVFLPATQAPATLDFGNSLPPSGLLELLGRAGAGWAQWEEGRALAAASRCVL